MHRTMHRKRSSFHQCNSSSCSLRSSSRSEVLMRSATLSVVPSNSSVAVLMSWSSCLRLSCFLRRSFRTYQRRGTHSTNKHQSPARARAHHRAMRT